jgi:hypothetical protein
VAEVARPTVDGQACGGFSVRHFFIALRMPAKLLRKGELVDAR